MPLLFCSFLSLLLTAPVLAGDLGAGPVPDPLPPTDPRVYRSFQFPDDRLPIIDGDLSDWEIVADEYVQTTYQLLNFHKGDTSLRRAYDPSGLALLHEKPKFLKALEIV